MLSFFLSRDRATSTLFMLCPVSEAISFELMSKRKRAASLRSAGDK